MQGELNARSQKKPELTSLESQNGRLSLKASLSKTIPSAPIPVKSSTLKAIRESAKKLRLMSPHMKIFSLRKKVGIDSSNLP